MSVQIPNVLCIKNLKLVTETNQSSVKIMTDPLPNMKANKLYYLLAHNLGEARLFHIKSSTINKDHIMLELGNSFQIKRCPKFTKDIEYVRLSDFGYQQLEPGCLVEIKNQGNVNDTTRNFER